MWEYNFLLADNGHLAIGPQADDGRRFVGLMLLTAAPADVVYLFYDAGIYVAIVLGSRFATDIGRG